MEDPHEEDTVPDDLDGQEGIDEEKGLEELLDEEIRDVDPADEEAVEDEHRHPVPEEVKKAVEFAHRQLGHPREAPYSGCSGCQGRMLMHCVMLATGSAMCAWPGRHQSILWRQRRP